MSGRKDEDARVSVRTGGRVPGPKDEDARHEDTRSDAPERLPSAYFCGVITLFSVWGSVSTLMASSTSSSP